MKNLQLLRSHNLLDVSWVSIEHEDQCLIVEIGHLALERGYVGNAVAVRQIVARNDGSWWIGVKQRVLLV